MADEYTAWLNAPRKKFRFLCDASRSKWPMLYGIGAGTTCCSGESSNTFSAGGAYTYGQDPRGAVVYTSLDLASSASGTLLTDAAISSGYTTDASNSLLRGPSSQSGYWRVDEVSARVPHCGVAGVRTVVTLWDMLWYGGPYNTTSTAITSTENAFSAANWPYAADAAEIIAIAAGVSTASTVCLVGISSAVLLNGLSNAYESTPLSMYVGIANTIRYRGTCTMGPTAGQSSGPKTLGFAGPVTLNSAAYTWPTLVVAKKICELMVHPGFPSAVPIRTPVSKKFDWGATGLASIRANPALMITMEGQAPFDLTTPTTTPAPVVHVTFSGD